MTTETYSTETYGVGGDAVVRLNRARKSFKSTLIEFFRTFNGGMSAHRTWDVNIPTRIRSLITDILGLNPVEDVRYTGILKVVTVTSEAGKSVQLTPNYEVCVDHGVFKPAELLRPGDVLLTNGKLRYTNLQGSVSGKGGLVEFVPLYDKVARVEVTGMTDVFEVTCKSRNIVANSFIVRKPSEQ